jgi:hypothetical protein
MKAIWKRTVAFSGVALAASALTVAALQVARAAVPVADGMTYTGYLQDGDGQPLSGDHSIEVHFMATADAADDLCTGTNEADTMLAAGRFQVPLPVACSEAVQASADVWVEVEVDGSRLGATKLGAVPYALEADHASNADNAAKAVAASGPLADELAQLGADVADLKGRLDRAPFYRYNAANLTISSTDWTWVSGTDPKDVKAGMYLSMSTTSVWMGASGCAGTCAYTQVKLSPCFRVSGALTVANMEILTEPETGGARPATVFDYYNFGADTAAVEFGVCAARRTASTAIYDGRVGFTYTIAIPIAN